MLIKGRMEKKYTLAVSDFAMPECEYLGVEWKNLPRRCQGESYEGVHRPEDEKASQVLPRNCVYVPVFYTFNLILPL